MGSNQIRIVHIPIIKVALRLHLRLHRLHHFTLAQNLVIHLNSSNLFERLGQHFAFISMGWNALG